MLAAGLLVPPPACCLSELVPLGLPLCSAGVAQGEPSVTQMSFGVLKGFTPEHTHFTTDDCKFPVFSMRALSFPVCEGCDKQMLRAPRQSLTFCLVHARCVGSQIRGNLTSRAGSAKESYFRHSSMGYLKR